MKRNLFVSLLCIVMVLTFTMAAYQSTLATSAGAESKSGYRAGTYTGKGNGREGAEYLNDRESGGAYRKSRYYSY